jgi:hypothetical protein
VQPGDCQAGLACTSAAIHITGSTGVAIDNCSITSVGSFAVWAHENSSDVTVTGSVLADLGAGGVRFGDGPGGAGGHPNNDWNLRFAVNNTLVADGGRLVAGAPGLLALGNCYNFSFTHNEVTGFPWSGISAGQVSSYAIKTAAGGYVVIGFLLKPVRARGMMWMYACCLSQYASTSIISSARVATTFSVWTQFTA